MESRKVFISYSHDSAEHKDRVFDLSERLIEDGVDSQIDQYEISPLGGWPRWTRNQIRDADYVIVVCTETYGRRYDGTEDPGVGAGARWEGAIITQQLYESEGGAHKFIPIVFRREDARHIPVELRGSTYYVLDGDEGYERLYRHITAQPEAVKGALGKLKSLPPKKRKQDFSGGAAQVGAGGGASQPAAGKTPSRNLAALVLIMTPEGNLLFVESERVRAGGEAITMNLLPTDSRDAAAIDSLSRYIRRDPVGLAFGSKAMYARVESVTHDFVGRRDLWTVELKPDQELLHGQRMYGEINLSGVSADEMAELRARRILLDEKLFGAGGVYRGMTNSLNQGLLEHSVQGRDGGLQIKGSPFPKLYAGMGDDPETFLAYARLYAVVLLILSNTVESIQQLELHVRGAKELSVKFEGQRAAYYSNEPPTQIKVKGVCRLVEEG